MANDYRLKSTVGSSYPIDLDDTWVLKQALRQKGFYVEPTNGMTPYPDSGLFEAIKKFQDRKGLHVDGVMEPDGETEQHMRSMFDVVIIDRCVHCGAPHGGVYSPRVCWQCWNKGLR